MRDLLNLLDLLEARQPSNAQELDAFKAVIANRIKQLPDDDVTAKALREIEDLLKNVNAGGKMGIINGKLAAIQDPTVDAAQKELNVSIQYAIGSRREGDPRRLVANSDAAKEQLNFKPKHNLQSILRTAYHWYERNRKSNSV